MEEEWKREGRMGKRKEGKRECVRRRDKGSESKTNLTSIKRTKDGPRTRNEPQGEEEDQDASAIGE